MFIEQRSQSQQTNRMLSLVNREAVKELKIIGFEHQTTPFIERSLMTSRNSIIRIIPGYDPATGKIFSTFQEGFDPEKADKDPSSALSGTFCFVSSVQPFGNQWRDVVLTAYPIGSDEENDRRMSGAASVLEKFVRVVNFCTDPNRKGRKPMQAHPDWYKWTGLKGQLGKVKWRLLMQAVIWLDSDRYIEVEDPNTRQKVAKPMVGVVGIDQSASVQQFMEDLVIRQNNRLPHDPFNNSNLGPVAELNGIWCNIHSEELRNDPSGAKFKLFPRPYAVGGRPTDDPQPYPMTEDWVRATWQPWEKILKWYTREEQFQLIADVFGPDTVNYFFDMLGEDQYSAFIPLDIKRRGYGRYQAMMPTSNNHGYGTYSAPVTVSTPPAMPGMPTGIPAPVIPQSVPAPSMPQSMPTPAPQMAAPQAAPVVPQTVVPQVPQMPTQVKAAYVNYDVKGDAPLIDPTPHMPQAPGLPPAVTQMMQSAIKAGVQVDTAFGDLGLPDLPETDDTIDLGDIVPSVED